MNLVVRISRIPGYVTNISTAAIFMTLTFITAARGVFPLGFGGQPFTHPVGISSGAVPSDHYYRVIGVAAHRHISAALFHYFAIFTFNIQPGFAAIALIAFFVYELAELGVGYFVFVHVKIFHIYFVDGFFIITIIAAHHKGAACYIYHIGICFRFTFLCSGSTRF